MRTGLISLSAIGSSQSVFAGTITTPTPPQTLLLKGGISHWPHKETSCF